MTSAQGVVVRTYKGSRSGAAEAFQKDAALQAAEGYFPTSQSWRAGREDLVLAHGLLAVVYVLRTLVKPTGTLTVTYQYRPSNP